MPQGSVTGRRPVGAGAAGPPAPTIDVARLRVAIARLSRWLRRHELAGLTPVAAQTVVAPRVLECPVQLEAKVEAVHGVAEDDPRQKGAISLIEVRIVRVHLEEQILMAGDRNRVDPDKWRPLIMSFQEFYGLAPNKVRPSTLAEIPERLYRAPDVDRAREEPMRVA